jgi:hypothetical protein
MPDSKIVSLLDGRERQSALHEEKEADPLGLDAASVETGPLTAAEWSSLMSVYSPCSCSAARVVPYRIAVHRRGQGQGQLSLFRWSQI